jgi:TRAP-type C4-dicarboxylate transport system permease small subunit
MEIISDSGRKAAGAGPEWNRIMHKVESGLRLLFRIEAILAVTAYSSLALTILGDVVAREVFTTPILGTQRFAVYMAMIAGFLGIGLATADGAHIRPRLSDGWFSGWTEVLVARLSYALSALVFAVTGYFSFEFWSVGYEMGDTAPVLDWPLWPIQLVIPYAFFSNAWRFALFAAFPALAPVSGEST